MRSLLWLAAVFTSLALALSGCSGDDPAPQTNQAAPAQSEQAEQPQAASAARAQPAQPQSDQSTPADADAEQQAQAQTEPAEQTEPPARFDDPLLAEAYAAFSEWAAGLDSLVLDVALDFNLGGVAAQTTSTIATQLDPLTILATVDAGQLLAMFGEALNGDPEALEMSLLMVEERVYLTMPSLDGWLDLTAEADDELLGMLGGDPQELSDPTSLGLPFDCIEAVGGTVAVGSHEGEPTWIVECEADAGTLTAEAVQALADRGFEIDGAGIEYLRLQVVISQTSGAPLLSVTETALADAFGLSADTDGEQDAPPLGFSTTAQLRSWNEPIAFPTPEPVVEGTLIDVFAELFNSEAALTSPEPAELLTQEELLTFASDWAASVDELHIQSYVQAVIEEESRLAATSSRSSRSLGAFETAVNIDDGSTFRLLWNREGVWISDAEENGQPIWAPSDPAQLGFGDQTVDDFLAAPGRLDFEPLRELLGRSWVTRSIEGGGPAVYELVFEPGNLRPGDPHFEQVAAMLKADTAELLADDVTVEEIELYSLVLTIMGDDGAVVSQITTAEFITSAGRVELVASLELDADGPFIFSAPGE